MPATASGALVNSKQPSSSMANSSADAGLKARSASAARDGESETSLPKRPTGKLTNLEVRAPKLPKIDTGFVPISMLVNRAVQHSWNGLQELIDSLQHSGQSDAEKKLKILNYANTTRQQFIKILVLSMWGENAAKVSNVIDLRVWLQHQRMTYSQVAPELFQIRRNMNVAKIRNPDLTTAMDILSTGEPKLGIMKYFVPPEKLTSKEILDTFRHINAILAIRLALDEDIPRHFREYSIGSGRATFTVEGEFAVDLAIGSEKKESPLYVVDVRFLWKPEIPLPAVTFQKLEPQLNAILEKERLEGLYTTLHEYCLTTKILLLFKEATEMLKGRWSHHLMIKQIKRTLVIQYWPQRKKAPISWIEIGIIRGDPTKLAVRWMRENKEVKDVEVPIDANNLSASTLIKTVIAMHTTWILTNLKDQLLQKFGEENSGRLQLKTHPNDTFKSYLDIELTPDQQCKVMIEPITGLFALQQPSRLISFTEVQMNEIPSNAPNLIFKLAFNLCKEEVESRAQSMGWSILKTLAISREDMKRFFPASTRYMLHMRRKGWAKNWIVTFLQEDSKSSWWITELRPVPESERNINITVDPHNFVHTLPPLWTILDSQLLPMKGETKADYRFLENLERMAAGMISHYVNVRELCKLGTIYSFRAPETPASYATAVRIPDLYVRFSSLIKASWGIDVIKICFIGLSPRDGECTLIVIGRTKEPMTQLGETNITETDSDVSFHPGSGSYAIRFNVSVGTPVIAGIIEKLHRIERLIAFVSVIRRLKLNCLHVSLGRIVFRYSDSPVLAAEIHFTGHTSPTTSSSTPAMKLILPPRTPHIRMHAHLQNALNRQGLEVVIKSLIASLPLMLAFNDLEAELPRQPLDMVFILTRALDWFRLEYRRFNYVIDLRLRARRGSLYWHITDPAAAEGNTFPSHPERRMCETLKPVWDESGEGWIGLRTGAAAELRGVKALLKRVHTAVMEGGAVQQKEMRMRALQKMKLQQQQQAMQAGGSGPGTPTTGTMGTTGVQQVQMQMMQTQMKGQQAVMGPGQVPK